MTSKTLIVIVGPTAIGKTALSISIAKKFNTEIISADSRQLFKEVPIGTAQPSTEEMQGIPHHFIASHSIKDDYNAGKFEKESIALLNLLFKQHSVAVLVGGSGLYVNALCNGFDDLPEVDEGVREKLNRLYQLDGIKALQEELKKQDPIYFNKVDLFNPQRIIRALEICMSSGIPYSTFLEKEKPTRNFNTIKIGLNTDRKKLYEKINQRVDEMMLNGFLNEAQNVYPYKYMNSLRTVGYTELFEFLDKKHDLATAISLIKQNTRRYAKRQLTWFNKDKEINWFEPTDLTKIISFLETQLTLYK